MDTKAIFNGGYGGEEFQTRQSQQLFEYYKALQNRMDCIMPPRSAFNPADIPRLLPNIVIMEWFSPEDCRFRLVGTATVERTGYDPTGVNFFILLPEDVRKVRSRNLNYCLTHPCAATGIQTENYGAGDPAYVEVTVFPFKSEDGEQPLAICVATEVVFGKYTMPRSDPQNIPEWKRHRFIDIGAGLPTL